jgi:two-component system, OmpR family, phosphate regulon sensor histidine kinase PhoR
MVDPGTRALHPPSRGIRTTIRRLGRRLGVAQLMLLLALLVPLVPGTWAFSELAARRETARVDSHLRASLAASVDEYGDVLAEAQRRALELARQPRVQRAFAGRDRRSLSALERRHADVRVLLPEEPAPKADATPGIDVLVGRRRVGRVIVPVRLQGETLGRLRSRAVLGPDERLAILRGSESPPGATRPVFIRLGGTEYRALAATLRPGTPRISLAVMRERAAIDAAAGSVRRRTVVLAMVALLAFALLAYLFAPSLARTRERRRQHAQAERVLSQLSDGVLEVDPDGVVTFWNPAAETLIGAPSDSVLGRRAADAIPGWPALESGVATIPLDTVAGERWLSVAAVDADGGTVFTFRDVTRERRLEEMRAELIATVSHELRTPLAAVYGAAMTLQRSASVDEATRAQLIGVVGNQAERLAKIVDGILTASRASVDAESLEEPFDAVALTRSAVEDALARSGRTITFAAAEESCRARGSAEEARRVVDNVLENAVKYSPDGTPISVRVELDADALRIEIADEGIGIPRDEQERIFERFYRLDPGMATGVGGTGLGLYIARRLVERMGGRLTVSSEPGSGSTFCIELRQG